MMILSCIATIVLTGALFYHRVNLPLLHGGVQDALHQTEIAIDDLSQSSRGNLAGRDDPSAGSPPLPIRPGQNLTPREHHPADQLEQALPEAIAAEVIHTRRCQPLKKCLSFLATNGLQEKWLNEEEAAVLTRAEARRLHSINVDEFAADALAAQSLKDGTQHAA